MYAMQRGKLLSKEHEARKKQGTKIHALLFTLEEQDEQIAVVDVSYFSKKYGFLFLPGRFTNVSLSSSVAVALVQDALVLSLPQSLLKDVDGVLAYNFRIKSCYRAYYSNWFGNAHICLVLCSHKNDIVQPVWTQPSPCVLSFSLLRIQIPSYGR